MRRPGPFAVLIGVGLALAATSGWVDGADRPALTPGWRVVQNLGSNAGATDISATAQSNAWAAGVTYTPSSAPASESLFVERWNGRAWHMIAVPKRFTGLPYPILETAEVSGAWAKRALVVVTLSNNGGTAFSQYGLIWNGHSSSTTKLASIQGPDGIAAFSGSDMWVFEIEAAASGAGRHALERQSMADASATESTRGRRCRRDDGRRAVRAWPVGVDDDRHVSRAVLRRLPGKAGHRSGALEREVVARAR